MIKNINIIVLCLFIIMVDRYIINFDIDVTLSTLLGNGSFGKVYSYNSNLTSYAVKVISTTKKRNNEDFKKINNELEVYSHLKHHPECTQIVQFIGWSNKVNNDSITYFMIYELMDTTLLRVVTTFLLPESIIQRIAKDIALAISFLHSIGVAHCDISMTNILCNMQNNNVSTIVAKLSDFDLCNSIQRKLDKSININPVLKSTYDGFMLYFAPEVILTSYGQKKSYNKKIDIWSYGVVILHMILGENPFIIKARSDGQTNKLYVYTLICNGYYKSDNANFNYISNELSQFIDKLLVVDANYRYSIEDVLSDKWINQSYNREI